MAQAIDRCPASITDPEAEFLDYILRQVQAGHGLNPTQEASLATMYHKYRRWLPKGGSR